VRYRIFKYKKFFQKLLTSKVFGDTISLSNEGSKQMERLNIDVNKLPLETYTQLVMIRAVNNLDTLEDAIVMLTNYYFDDEREDD
jgi:hypothetical protein